MHMIKSLSLSVRVLFFIMYAGPKVVMIMTSALWNIGLVMEYMLVISISYWTCTYVLTPLR